MDVALPPAPGSQVRYRPKVFWPAVVFVPLWLVGWTFGGWSALRELLEGDTSERAFLVVWLLFWLAGEVMAVAMIAFWFAGRGTLTVTQAAIEDRVSLWRLSRTARYEFSRIQELRAGDGAVELVYDGEPVRLGNGLTRTDLEWLVGLVRVQHRPQADAVQQQSRPDVFWRRALFPLIVVVVLVYLAAQTLSGDGQGAVPAFAGRVTSPQNEEDTVVRPVSLDGGLTWPRSR